MTLPTYETGTVSINDGDTVFVGVGTIWSGVNAKPGDKITIDGSPLVEIKDISDVTHGTLWSPWSYGDKVGTSYTIVQDYPSRVVGVAAAEDVGDMLAQLNSLGPIFNVPIGETEPDQSFGADGQYAEQPSTGKKWVKEGGLWVYIGIFGLFSFDPTPWSSATTYNQGDARPFMGKTWVSLQGSNLNHRPDLSPTYWTVLAAGGDTVYLALDDSDRPASGEDVLQFIVPEPLTLYAGLSKSYARGKVGATLTAVYSVQKNGVQFATITFAAGGQAGPQFATFACVSDVVFSAGDVLEIIAPSPRDATLSGIAITLTGSR